MGYAKLPPQAAIVTPEEAGELIADGMTVAFGGYTSAGYPKAVARSLSVSSTWRNRPGGIHMISGSTSRPLENLLSEAGIIKRRTPMLESRLLSSRVNKGEVQYCEQQMSKMPRLVRTGVFGKVDVAIIEAIELYADGKVVPTSAVGMISELAEAADHVIVEINTAQPSLLNGMHDIYQPGKNHPIPIVSAGDKIGTPYVQLDPNKIRFVVYSHELDETISLSPSTSAQEMVARNLFDFLELEGKKQGWKELPPIQTGFGNLAGEVVRQMGNSNFRDITFFCGGVQEANVALLAQGKARCISCGSVELTSHVLELMNVCPEAMKEGIIIRNGSITNNAEVISRLAPITLTSGIEMDIYGNVNSSHVLGNRIINGLGGGANFAQNAGLSMLMLVSEGKEGRLSSIVPMVSHQDISEHDIDVVITEHGVADLRGRSDMERADTIIKYCAGSYQSQLRDYFKKAKLAAGGHHPVLLEEAFSWHIAYRKNGSMRL